MTPDSNPHHGREFTAAWSEHMPGSMTRPGPRQNTWGTPAGANHAVADASVPIAEVLDTLWRARGVHTNPATGAPGTIPQRAIPSAGACYPVQVHLLCGTCCDVPPGIHAYNAEDSTTHRRTAAAPAMAGAILVFSVLPQRTAARYHHRALPLLLADTAYALLGVSRHAASRGLKSRWLTADPATLAAVARLPDYAAWQGRWPDTAPELALTALAVGAGDELPSLAQWGMAAAGPAGRPQPCPQRQPRTVASVEHWAAGPGLRHPEHAYDLTPGAVLGTVELLRRRSLPIHSPISNLAHPVRRVPWGVWRRLLGAFPLPAPAGCDVVVLGQEDIAKRGLHLECAGQEWVHSLDGILLLRTRAAPDEAAMWWAAGAAAHLLYSSLATGREHTFRPVAGWTGTRDGFTTLHALGFRAQRSEGNTHVGQ